MRVLLALACEGTDVYWIRRVERELAYEAEPVGMDSGAV